MADDKPVIIIKKTGGHGGHHGGAWKVAYADFVTAMMAFFMVMWLVNSADSATKKNIASYFRKPGLFETGSGTPLLIGESGILTDGQAPSDPSGDKDYKDRGPEPNPRNSGTDAEMLEKSITLRGEKADGLIKEDVVGKGRSMDTKPLDPEIYQESSKKPKATVEGKTPIPEKSEGAGQQSKRSKEEQELNELAQRLRQEIRALPKMKEKLGNLEVKMEPDGLVLEIMDTDKSSMFALGSASILPEAREAFGKVGELLAQFPNKIDIIGHTDGKNFGGGNRKGYSNWELSADRANAARNLMTNSGIGEQRILSVVGRADRELKVPSDPLAAANRRITLKMRFTEDQAVPVNDIGEKVSDFNTLQATQTQQLEETEELETVEEVNLAVPEETPKIAGYAPWKQPKRSGTKAVQHKRDTIALPDEQDLQNSPNYIEKDKIFGDNPVFGPAGAPF